MGSVSKSTSTTSVLLATLAEFDKAEAEWREIAERQVLHLCEIEDPLPTPEELDELDPDEAVSRIETVVENNTQLCFAYPTIRLQSHSGCGSTRGSMANLRQLSRRRRRRHKTFGSLSRTQEP
jgi:hypothetical protein